MKKLILIGSLMLGTFTIISCTANKTAQSATADGNNIEVSTRGTITHIENGKDGYMATVKDAEGKEYIATISIVNLHKSGSAFKRYEVGDTITVKGPSWQDEQGKIYIKVEKLN